MADGNKNIRIRLIGDTKQFTASMATASKTAQSTAQQLEQGGAKSALLSKGIMVAGAAATALGVAAVSMAANFDQGMSEVQAATHASTGDMEALRQAALDAGADTVFSATEAADGIVELGKAGMNTGAILSGGLSGALDLAASDGMAVGAAAELMASSLAQFNLQGKDASKVADALAAGAGNAQGGASDLGMALSQTGLVANSMGLSMEETTGTLSAFAKAGLIGSDAGTSLKTMLQRLSNPTKKSRDEMEKLGISAYDAQGNFVGLSKFAGELKSSMSGLTQEQRNAAMGIIFGSDAVRAANVLYDEGAKGISNWSDIVSDSGYASEQAAKRTDNLKGDLEGLSGSFETLMINMGEGGQGPIRWLVQNLGTLVDVFASLPAPVSQTMVLLTGLAGAAVGVHKATGNLHDSQSGLVQGFANLIDPIGVVQAGIANYGAAADVAAKKQVIMNTAASLGKTALAGLAGAAAMWVASQFLQSIQDYTQRVKDYSEALKSADTATGKVSAAQDLLKEKFFDSAEVENTKTALDALNMSWDEFSTVMTSGGDATVQLSDRISNMLTEADNATALGKESTRVSGEQYKALSKMSEMVRENARQIGDASEQDKARLALMGETTEATEQATTANAGINTALQRIGETSEKSADQLKDYIDQLFQLPGMAISSDQAMTQLNQTILDLTQQVTENGVVLDANGNALAGLESKGYDAQSSLQGLASQAQNAAQKILEEGQATGDMKGATDQANATLGQARDAFINAATAAGMSRDAAEDLANQYGLIPGSVKTDVIANDQATAVIDAVKNLSIADKFFTIHGSYVDDSGGTYTRSGYRPRGATGTIPFATGGYISGPGTATSDSIPARLSNGEYVIRASAVDHYGVSLFDKLNYNRYAAGGLVQAYQATPSPTKFDSGQGKVTYLQTVNLKMYGTGSSSVDAQRAASRIRASSNALISMNGM